MADDERRTVLLAAAVGVALAIAGGWWWTRDTGPGPADAPEAAPSAASPAAAAGPAPAPLPIQEDAPTVESGQTLRIERTSLPDDGPFVLHLRLREPSTDAEPRPGRLVSADGRVVELSGRLDTDRTRAQIEIDPAWLTPGRYLIEVKTTERSHFPLLRYVLEVR